MQHSVAKYGKLLLIIGVIGFLAGGMRQWTMIAPALLGLIAAAVTSGPLRTSSETVAAVAGTLIALLALFGSSSAAADMPAAMAGDPSIDGPLTLSHALTSLVSLSVLLGARGPVAAAPSAGEVVRDTFSRMRPSAPPCAGSESSRNAICSCGEMCTET